MDIDTLNAGERDAFLNALLDDPSPSVRRALHRPLRRQLGPADRAHSSTTVARRFANRRSSRGMPRGSCDELDLSDPDRRVPRLHPLAKLRTRVRFPPPRAHGLAADLKASQPVHASSPRRHRRSAPANSSPSPQAPARNAASSTACSSTSGASAATSSTTPTPATASSTKSSRAAPASRFSLSIVYLLVADRLELRVGARRHPRPLPRRLLHRRPCRFSSIPLNAASSATPTRVFDLLLQGQSPSRPSTISDLAPTPVREVLCRELPQSHQPLHHLPATPRAPNSSASFVEEFEDDPREALEFLTFGLRSTIFDFPFGA